MRLAFEGYASAQCTDRLRDISILQATEINIAVGGTGICGDVHRDETTEGVCWTRRAKYAWRRHMTPSP